MTPTAARKLTPASSWLTRMPEPGLPIQRESVRSPSIQTRPSPYQATYIRKICPSYFRFLDRMWSRMKPTRFQTDSYRKVGCQYRVVSTGMPLTSSRVVRPIRRKKLFLISAP